MMIGILIPFLLLIPTPAKACSPPRDGSEFTCPPWDDVVVCLSLDCPRKPLPQPNRKSQVLEDDLDPNAFDHNKLEVILYDTREEKIAHMGHSFPTPGEWIDKIRQSESEANRVSVEDMLNSSLAEYENGSDGSTESEELLQLSSDGDSKSP